MKEFKIPQTDRDRIALLIKGQHFTDAFRLYCLRKYQYKLSPQEEIQATVFLITQHAIGKL